MYKLLIYHVFKCLDYNSEYYLDANLNYKIQTILKDNDNLVLLLNLNVWITMIQKYAVMMKTEIKRMLLFM